MHCLSASICVVFVTIEFDKHTRLSYTAVCCVCVMYACVHVYSTFTCAHLCVTLSCLPHAHNYTSVNFPHKIPHGMLLDHLLLIIMISLGGK